MFYLVLVSLFLGNPNLTFSFGRASRLQSSLTMTIFGWHVLTAISDYHYYFDCTHLDKEPWLCVSQTAAYSFCTVPECYSAWVQWKRLAHHQPTTTQTGMYDSRNLKLGIVVKFYQVLVQAPTQLTLCSRNIVDLSIFHDNSFYIALLPLNYFHTIFQGLLLFPPHQG